MSDGSPPSTPSAASEVPGAAAQEAPGLAADAIRRPAPESPPISAEELADGRALQSLLEVVSKTHATAEHGIVVRAFEIGVAAHEGQRRKSGEPYYIHPVRVAHGIAQLEQDRAVVFSFQIQNRAQ